MADSDSAAINEDFDSSGDDDNGAEELIKPTNFMAKKSPSIMKPLMSAQSKPMFPLQQQPRPGSLFHQSMQQKSSIGSSSMLT